MPHTRFDRKDFAFIALGVIGLVLYVWLVPRFHPDSAATFGIGAEQAGSEAREFLMAAGYSTDGLEPVVRLVRHRDLVDSLQVRLGRANAIQALLDGGRAQIPAHYWSVYFMEPGGGSTSESRPLRVRLFSGGGVWHLAVVEGREPAGAWLEEESDVSRTFEFYRPQNESGPVTPTAPRADDLNRSQQLGSADAEMLARARLAETALTGLPLDVVAVEAHPTRGRNAARVRFETTDPVLGQEVSVDIDITTSGALLGIRTRFNGADEERTSVGSLPIDPDRMGHRDAIKFAVYILLIVMLAFVAIRRLSTRSIDVRAALKDAFLVAVFSALSIILALPMIAVDIGGGIPGVMLFLVVIIIANGFLFAALTFVTSAGGDALARDHHPATIRTLALMREGLWKNAPVGHSVLQGLGLGGLLVGLAAVLYAVFPQSLVPSPRSVPHFESQITYSVVASALADRFVYVVVVTHAVFVGLGAFFQRWRPALVIPGLALVLALIDFDLIFRLPVGSEVISWLCALAVGAVLAYVYRRTDALTMFVGLMVSMLIWNTREPLLLPGSPAVFDLAILAALLLGVAAVGWVAVRAPGSGSSAPEYEPEFITEQRERARMQRDLEIARQVHDSMLPKRLPVVAGLDMAARCIPAQEVGGDYYDLIPIGKGRLAIIIGDVSGKGIQAAFYMTLVKGFIHALAFSEVPPARVLRRLNSLFRDSVPAGTFVSMIYGIIDTRTGTMTFARAGHTPLVIRPASGTIRTLRPPGIAIGLTDDARFEEIVVEETVVLSPSDVIVLYTDGISEAMNHRRDQFTDERVVDTIDKGPALAGEMLDEVVTRVQRHVGHADQHDDLTMVVVRISSRDGVRDVEAEA